MFDPPRCPNRSCSRHLAPGPKFFQRWGSYHPKCRAHRIPRFLCRGCGKTFSRQTFRMDFGDHRPDLNSKFMKYLNSGVGLRQGAKNMKLDLRCAELKFRKIARHLRRLNLNLRASLPEGAVLQFDELETYEGRRNTRPLTLPILIETESRFVVWAESATIRPRGKKTEARRRAIAEDERRFGKRRDCSRSAIRRTLQRGAQLAEGLEQVRLGTDEKSSYPKLAQEAFGSKRLIHQRTNSKLPRTSWNPLFPINHTEAIARDLIGRLRRNSWLVSKKRRYLDLAMQVFIAYRNYIRPRFNRDEKSPAQFLGFAKRRMTENDVLSWRQDWGGLSPHPLGAGRRTVAAGLA